MFDPKIAISGAADGLAVKQGHKLAFTVGMEIAKRGGVVLTGATSGIPLAGAKGAKSIGGEVIGFSPAHSMLEHTAKYRLPTQYHDTLFFTGYDYAGRDAILVDFADAVIQVSGRIGSLHEFTTAFERHKIIGLLLHSGGIIDEIPEILEMSHRGFGRVIMDPDPASLVRQVFHAYEEANHSK